MAKTQPVHEMSSFERVVLEVEKKLADDSVKFRTGMKSLQIHDQLKRVVWVWGGGLLASPTNTGAIESPDGTVKVTPLYTNAAVVQAHIQAPGGYVELEALWAGVLVAVDAAIGKASKPTGPYEIITETVEEAANVFGGTYLLQSFEWDLVLAKATNKLTQVTSIVHSCALDLNL
jgi:hypothetical protein